MSCEYFVQIGAYGNKKYAYEAQEILGNIELISINEIYSTSNPGKLLFSVLSGPYENRSAANNAKEQITKNGFDPRLRTLCKKN
jgi:cell division protein FtsN